MTCQELAAGTEEEKKGLSLERRNQKRFSSFPSLPPCPPPPQWGDGERPYLEGARVAGEDLAGRGSGPWGKRWEASPRLGWGGGMTLDGKVPPSLLLEEARRRQMQVSLRCGAGVGEIASGPFQPCLDFSHAQNGPPTHPPSRGTGTFPPLMAFAQRFPFSACPPSYF